MKIRMAKSSAAFLICCLSNLAHSALISSSTDAIYKFDPSYVSSSAYTFVTYFDDGIGGNQSLQMSLGTTPGSSSYGTFTLTNPFSTRRDSYGFGFLRNDDGGLLAPPAPNKPLYATLRYAGSNQAVDDLYLTRLGGSATVCSGSTPGCDPKGQKGRLVAQPSATSTIRDLSLRQQGASVLEAFRNYISVAPEITSRRNEINAIYNECASNNGRRKSGEICDYASLRAGEVEANLNLIKDANEATFASVDLVTRTSILPGESTIEKIADAPFLIDLANDFFKFIGDVALGDENSEVESIVVNGEKGEFEVNPNFDLYLMSYVIDFKGQSIFDQVLGKSFLYDYSFGGKSKNAGYGYVESVDALANGGQRVTLSFAHLETNDFIPNSTIPLPGTLPLLILGFLGLCLTLKNQAK